MKSSTKDQAKGKFHKVKGKLEEIAGELSDNPDLEAEGTGEKIAAKFRKRSDRSRRSWVIEQRDAVGLNNFLIDILE
jgi:uncharacterized protein YjbJ (UPF0337 family)